MPSCMTIRLMTMISSATPAPRRHMLAVLGRFSRQRNQRMKPAGATRIPRIAHEIPPGSRRVWTGCCSLCLFGFLLISAPCSIKI